ncbi:hypothetical protein F4814DRAFT_423644 [Daldinia grandis]|nr:hypothetical protein F4814DRAFT_423644 [Daldinia grandis]
MYFVSKFLCKCRVLELLRLPYPALPLLVVRRAAAWPPSTTLQPRVTRQRVRQPSLPPSHFPLPPCKILYTYLPKPAGPIAENDHLG